jgi:hypothetical protein
MESDKDIASLNYQRYVCFYAYFELNIFVL